MSDARRFGDTRLAGYFAVRARLQLARIYSTRGDQSVARHLLREIDELLLHRPALGASIRL